MSTVAEMSKTEFQEIIESIIEQKLLEILGDPDEGLPLRKAIHERLLHQKNAVALGERGASLEDVVRQLELA